MDGWWVGGCPGGRLASSLVDVCANCGRGHPACSGACQCPPAAQEAHLLSLPAHRLQTYAQLLVEVANGRDLREAVKAAAKDVGVDLGGWVDGWRWLGCVAFSRVAEGRQGACLLAQLACRRICRMAACCQLPAACCQLVAAAQAQGQRDGSLACHCHTDEQPLTAGPCCLTSPRTACNACTAERVLKYNYEDTEVVQRVFGSACYITDSFPRWVVGRKWRLWRAGGWLSG